MLAAPTANVRDVLTVAGFTSLFEIIDSLGDLEHSD